MLHETNAFSDDEVRGGANVLTGPHVTNMGGGNVLGQAEDMRVSRMVDVAGARIDLRAKYSRETDGFASVEEPIVTNGRPHLY